MGTKGCLSCKFVDYILIAFRRGAILLNVFVELYSLNMLLLTLFNLFCLFPRFILSLYATRIHEGSSVFGLFLHVTIY